MKSPSPSPYHQNAMAVATSRARRALAMRLRSSVRWATRVIVACGSRGFRWRRLCTPLPASLTVDPPGTAGSAGSVDRARLLGTDGRVAGLGGRGLALQLRRVVPGRRRDDLAAHGCHLGGVLGPDVVALH